MDIIFYNTLTRKKEIFIPLAPGKVTLYTCGPTVYNYPHIGNYRAYITADIIKRYLQYCGYEVNHIMNITDVDDKTIRDSQAHNQTLKEFTEFYTEEFFKDRDMLHIIPPTLYTKATDYIDEMVAMIEVLLEKGFAYKASDGSVYFNIAKDTNYGALSQVTLSTLKENADGRMIKDEYDKESASDFALWKAWDEKDGDVFWITSLGKGRPGWHIECSAMSIAKLGKHIDIHTGGIDLIFPHHENEIAQSECSSDSPFVNYWIHNEHLMVDDKKMSKSLGNFYTLRDLIDKGIPPLAFRYWLHTGHYRTRVNFTLESLEGSATALKRLYELYKQLGNNSGTVSQEYNSKMKEIMNNDFNTPQALALLWDMMKDITLAASVKKATMLKFDKIFGFGLNTLEDDIIPENITSLAEERLEARKNNEWAKSDGIRDQIKELGYEIKDIDSGFKISKI